MASAEMQLVCRIIKTGELKRVLEWGITSEDFMMLETQAIFNQIIAIYTDVDTSGSIMGPRLAASKFTQLNLDDVDDFVTLDHLCKEVRNRRLAKEMKEKAQEAIECADATPMQAFALLQEATAMVMKLDSGKSTDVSFASGMTQVMENYEKRKRGEIVGKIPWPWRPLQEETGGVQEDDYCVFYGRPKSMKSWVVAFLIAWAVEAPWMMSDVPLSSYPRVLVYTKEMTPLNFYQRIAACLAGLPYGDMRQTKLTEEQEATLRDWVAYAQLLEHQGRLIVLSAKDVPGRDTVSWLKSKVEKYVPDVVFIDGLYLMSPENPKIVKDNERVASISRAIRQMILDTKTPVIATMQANRKAAGHERAELDEIAFSDAISQDCTMATRVINDKTTPTISLIIGGSREFYLPGLRIRGVPAVDFSYDSVLTEADIMKAKDVDNPEEEQQGGKRKSFKAKNLPKTDEQRAYEANYKSALNGI